MEGVGTDRRVVVYEWFTTLLIDVATVAHSPSDLRELCPKAVERKYFQIGCHNGGKLDPIRPKPSVGGTSYREHRGPQNSEAAVRATDV